MVTGPHLGPRRSCMQWLAVTAGWGCTAFNVGDGRPWAREPYQGQGSSAVLGPQRGQAAGSRQGCRRTGWGGTWGRGHAAMARARAGRSSRD